MSRISIALIMSLLLIEQSASASTASNVTRLEKLFLDGKYSTVISESNELINSGYAKKDELHYLKGLSELKASRYADARASFSYILDHYPRSNRAFDARLGMGDSYFLEGNNSKALSVYSEMAGLYSGDKNISIVHGRISLCYSKMGFTDRANSYLKKVKAASPHSFEARSDLFAPQGVRTQAAVGSAPSGAKEWKYAVQVGSFKNKRNADKLVRKLSKKGYNSYISIPVLSTDKFYRVKVGDFISQTEASGAVARLRSDGYRTKFCTDEVCE